MKPAALLAWLRATGIEAAPGEGPTTLLRRALQQKYRTESQGLGSGYLDLRPDGYGFLRPPAGGGLPGACDIYMSAAQIRHLRLRPGSLVRGQVRAPRPDEEYFAMTRVESVDGQSPDQTRRQTTLPFAELPAVLPHTPLQLPTAATPPTWLRGAQACWPLHRGQRLLLQLHPDLDGSAIAPALQHLAGERTRILCLLVGADPGLAERWRQDLPGIELFTSPVDAAPRQHGDLLLLVQQRLQRLVEAGSDCLLLVDDLTALVEAANLAEPHSGKMIAPGLDATSLRAAQRLFSSARQIDGPGSLSICATVQDDIPGSSRQAIAAWFRGQAQVCWTMRHAADGAQLDLRPGLCFARQTAVRPDPQALARRHQIAAVFQREGQAAAWQTLGQLA